VLPGKVSKFWKVPEISGRPVCDVVMCLVEEDHRQWKPCVTSIIVTAYTFA
jgi:hypothetical protein